MNVLRPAGASKNSELPVAVWIHGGGFVLGQTSIYDATDLIVRSVVRVSRASTQSHEHMLTIRQDMRILYVSINHHLGSLGWLQGAEAAKRGLLNLGLKDQLVAS